MEITETYTMADKCSANKKSKAFTLAEVLITLGIIGVVAAMTLPTLIQKYQNLVLETQLKKTYTTLSQGIQKAMADEGVTSFYDTELFSACKEETQDACKQVLKKYFKMVNSSTKNREYYHLGIREVCNQGKCVYRRDQKWTAANGMLGNYRGFGVLYTLSDGAQFQFNCPLDVGSNCVFFIDVNGEKSPNTSGLDIYTISVKGDSGKLYPDDSNTRIIMENGWKIPY